MATKKELRVSEGFGYYSSDEDGQASGLNEQAPAGAEPKWFRDYMDKARQQNAAMREELDKLRAESRRTKVAQEFAAKGYDPAVAALYGGEPDKVDEWLGTHGALLAKRPEGAESAQEGVEQAPAGPPASSVPPEVQAQMRQMSAAGTAGTAAPKGSEAELTAAIQAISSPEALAEFMRTQGSRFEF